MQIYWAVLWKDPVVGANPIWTQYKNQFMEVIPESSFLKVVSYLDLPLLRVSLLLFTLIGNIFSSSERTTKYKNLKTQS